uniref:Uncharacterized protein n=1 Tax=Loa loa TaxID=7209 RepID=A0A1I7VQR7_LOALO
MPSDSSNNNQRIDRYASVEDFFPNNNTINPSSLSLLVSILGIRIPPLIIERKIFKTIRARITSNETDDKTIQNAVEHKSNVELFRQWKNDEIIELAPMISPMNRTKRWIEENHGDLKTSARSRHAIVNRVRHHQTTTSAMDIFCRQAKKSDGSVGSDAVSTCKSFSEDSANGKQISKNEPKSSTVMMSKTKRQFGNITGDTEDIVHQTGIIMEKQYTNAQKIDKLMEQKQMKQSHDKEVLLSENIGFSWIEEIKKRFNVGWNTHSRISHNKKRIMAEHNGTNKQQQHFDIHLLDEQIPMSNKSSSSTITGETIIHVINDNPAESYS